jgi:hypothetical protein
LAPQQLVFAPRAAQPQIVLPNAPHAVDGARRRELHARDKPERHVGSQLCASALLYLRGDQDDVPQHHREEQIAGAAANV